jgi:hypothetical protein
VSLFNRRPKLKIPPVSECASPVGGRDAHPNGVQEDEIKGNSEPRHIFQPRQVVIDPANLEFSLARRKAKTNNYQRDYQHNDEHV